ncbi:DUF6479 family protein [Streptomyces zaomyceticus]|uniref:DUF6479 family protein n=1 Tax=Streptomyces zaomyceticus TaxID=68286 RepID=UPI0036B6DA3F
MHVFIGVVVVAVLLAAFVFGSRLRDQEAPPPDPATHPRRPPTNQIPGEVLERRRHVAVPKSDRANRLRPYQIHTSTEPLPFDEP